VVRKKKERRTKTTHTKTAMPVLGSHNKPIYQHNKQQNILNRGWSCQDTASIFQQ